MEMEQIIEVEYNKDMVEEDLKAQKEQNEELLVQDNFNKDGIDKLLGEGVEIDDYIENN